MPVSDLRNYNKVLEHCGEGTPVFLTKNGYGKYVIMDIEEYQKTLVEIEMGAMVAESERRMKSSADKTIDVEELKRKLGYV